MEATRITISLHKKTKQNNKKNRTTGIQTILKMLQECSQICHVFHITQTRGYNDEKWNRKECLLLTHPKQYRQQKLLKYIVYSFIWIARIMYFQIENKQHRGSTPSFFLQPHSVFSEKIGRKKKMVAMKYSEFYIVSAEIW